MRRHYLSGRCFCGGLVDILSVPELCIFLLSPASPPFPFLQGGLTEVEIVGHRIPNRHADYDGVDDSYYRRHVSMRCVYNRSILHHGDIIS